MHLSLPSQAKDAISEWKLGRIDKWKLACRGVVNYNFILTTTEGKFVLRKVAPGHHAGPTDMRFELSYLSYLRRSHFPYEVPSPILTIDGKRFATVEGHFWWVYRFIEGTMVETLDESRLRQLAKMVASYHLLIERSGLGSRRSVADPYNRAAVMRELQNYRLHIRRRHRNNSDDVKFLEESAILLPILRSLDARSFAGLEKYPVHGDICPENMIWRRGRLAGLLDFENACSPRQPLVKDIAIILQSSCRVPRRNHQLDLSRARLFLHQYSRYHPMSERESHLIPSLIVAGFIEDFAFAYWMLRNDPARAQASRLGSYSRAAQWSNSNRDRIRRELS